MAFFICLSRVRLLHHREGQGPRASGVDWHIRMVLRPGSSIALPASDTSDLHLTISYTYIYSLIVHRLYSRYYSISRLQQCALVVTQARSMKL